MLEGFTLLAGIPIVEWTELFYLVKTLFITSKKRRVLFLVKYLYIFVFKVLLNPSTMAPFMSGLSVVWKLTPWLFKYRWTVSLTNSMPLCDCIVIGFLYWSKDLKADVIELPVFCLKVCSRHNPKRCLLRLRGICTCRISRGNLNLQDPFPRHH